MRKIIFILLSVIVYYACNDDYHAVNPEVTFSEFTDPRDMKIYQCVTIGGQTWMAENLKYRLPLGSMDGCYTFNESAARQSDAKISAELFGDSLDVAIARGELSEPLNAYYTVGDMARMYVVDYQMPVSDVIAMFKGMGLETSCPNSMKAIQRIYNNLLPFALVEVVAKNLKDIEAKNGNYSLVNGFLYTYDGATKAIPEGWRLPSDEDWKKLEETLGMSLSELDKLDVWRGEDEGYLLKAGKDGCGFNALYGGARVFGTFTYGTNFINRGSRAYFWSSSKAVENDSINYGIIRLLSADKDQILRGTSDLTAAYSVRCVKE